MSLLADPSPPSGALNVHLHHPAWLHLCPQTTHLRKQDAQQETCHDGVVVHEPYQHGVGAAPHMNDVLGTQALCRKRVVSARDPGFSSTAPETALGTLGQYFGGQYCWELGDGRVYPHASQMPPSTAHYHLSQKPTPGICGKTTTKPYNYVVLMYREASRITVRFFHK